jgi:outer membrane lipoprotein-sorting protein
MKFKIKCLVVIVVVASGCVSTKRYARFTKEKLSEIKQSSQAVFPEYLEIKTDSLNMKDSLVKVEKLKSFFIPAILYWQSEHTLKCEINPKVPVKIFEQEMIRLADSLDLKSKLNGRKIELTLLHTPNSFIYTHKEMVMIFIIAYTVSGIEAIYPENSGLKVSYRITENGETKKDGIITTPNRNDPIKNMWKSTKRFTWAYLEQYKQNNTEMSRDFFKQLMSVL